MEANCDFDQDQSKRKSSRLLDRENQRLEEEKRKQKLETKRRNKLFQRRNNVIGPSDMIVDLSCNKIKLEPEGGTVAIKEESTDQSEATPMAESVDDFHAMGTVPEQTAEQEDESLSIDKYLIKFVTDEVEIPNDVEEEISQADEHVLINLNELDSNSVPTAVTTHPVSQSNPETSEVAKLKEMLTTSAQKNTNLKNKVEELEVENRKLRERVGQLEKEKQMKKTNLWINEDLEIRGLNSANVIANNDTDTGDRQIQQISSPTKLDSLQLEQVFKILAYHGKDQTGNVNWQLKCNLLKKCRLVSKTWRASIDQFLQNDPSHLQLWAPFVASDHEIYPSPVPLCMSNSAHRWSVTRNIVNVSRDPHPGTIGYFLMSFKSSSQDELAYNPIPTRNLEVKLPTGFDGVNVVKRLTDYFRIFGSEVWYVSFNFQKCKAINYAVCVDMLSQVLSFLPNLRSLKIDFQSLQSLKAIPLKELFANPQEYPLIRHLIFLKLNRGDSISTFHLLRANPQIQKLYLRPDFSQLQEVGMMNIMKLDLPSLTELFVTIGSEDQWRSLTKVSWKLEILVIRFVSFQVFKFSGILRTPWEMPINIWGGIKRFGNTLKTLSLEISRISSDGFGLPGPSGDTALPCLEHLHFYFEKKSPDSQEWYSIMRRLKLPNLLKVAVFCDARKMVDLVDLEDLYSICDESNWANYPRLTSVTQMARVSANSDNLNKKVIQTRAGLPTVTIVCKFIIEKSKETGDYDCIFCGKSYQDNSKLLQHILPHIHEKPYDCEFCGMGFARKTERGNHMRIHANERPYKCEICGTGFLHMANMQTHKNRHSRRVN